MKKFLLQLLDTLSQKATSRRLKLILDDISVQVEIGDEASMAKAYDEMKKIELSDLQ